MTSPREIRHAIGRGRVRIQRMFASRAARHRLVQKLGKGVWALNTAGLGDTGILALSGWVAPTTADAGLTLLVEQTPCDVLHLSGEPRLRD